MPAGDFSAAEFPNVLVALNDIQNTDIVDMELDAPVVPLETLARRQSVTMKNSAGEILKGGKCNTVKAYHTVVGSHLLAHSRTGYDPAQGCDLKTGQQLQAVAKEYNKNYNIKSSFQVREDECDNASQFNEKVAKGLARAMATNRRELQANFLYAMLNNNSQLNEANPGVLPEFVDEGTANRLKVAPANWNFELLLKMKLLAQQNYLGSFIVINGSNFYFDSKVAEFRKLNDNQRDQHAIFSDMEVAWDTRDLDVSVQESATFLVSLSAPCIWNSAWWSDIPTLKDPSSNYYQYKIKDDVLSYNNGGTLIPFYHHVETKYMCVDRDENDQPIYAHTFNVTMIGGMHRAPDGFNWPLDTSVAPARTRTGIISVFNKA